MKKNKSIDGGFIKPEVDIFSDNSEVFIKNFTPSKVVEIDEVSNEVKELQREIFNMKFNYDTLLNFTCQLLSHEQHVKFAAKKKEIFG